jgi:outer membrane protein TolC
MSRMARTIGALLLAGVPAVVAWAQDGVPAFATAARRSVTMTEAFAIALDSNADIQLARARVEGTRGTVLKSKSPLLPQVYALTEGVRTEKSSARSGFNEDLTITRTREFADGEELEFRRIMDMPDTVGPYDFVEATVNGSVDFYNLERLNQYRASAALLAQTELELSAQSEDVLSQVALLYVSILAQQEANRLLAEKQGLMQQKLRLVQEKQAAGKATDLDVRKARLALTGLALELTKGTNDLMNLDREFHTILGLRPETRATPSEAVEVQAFDPGDPSMAVSTALKARPDYRAQLQCEAVARHNLNAAKMSYVPTFTLFGSFGQEGDGIDNTVNGWTFGARAQIPIWDSFGRYGKRVERDSQLVQAETRTQALERQVRDEVHAGHGEVLQSTQALQFARETVSVARDEVALARDQLASGTATTLDVLESEVDLSEAQFQEIRSACDWQLARIRWFKAIGNVTGGLR